jgi:hypothetical protein
MIEPAAVDRCADVVERPAGLLGQEARPGPAVDLDVEHVVGEQGVRPACRSGRPHGSAAAVGAAPHVVALHTAVDALSPAGGDYRRTPPPTDGAADPRPSGPLGARVLVIEVIVTPVVVVPVSDRRAALRACPGGAEPYRIFAGFVSPQPSAACR